MFTEVLAKIEQVKSYLYVVGEQYRELWGEGLVSLTC